MGVRAAPVLASLALLAAACGGGGGGGHALPAAADIVPASAPALISINTDFSSEQWKHELALVHRFPGAADLLRRASSEAGNLDFDRDVKPALGPEVDVVWLDFANGGSDVVALTQPKDRKKFGALIAKGNSSGDTELVTARIGGWTAAADARAKLQKFRRASSSGQKLADASAFDEAMSKLDDTAAVRAYVAGRPVQQALDDAFESGGAPPNLTRAVGRLGSLSVSTAAEENGARFEGGIAIDPTLDPEPYAATLPDDFPRGALLYVSANSLDDMTRTVLRLVGRSLPNFETQLSQVEALLGFRVEADVLPLLAHEAAFALYPARPLPIFAVVIRVEDTAEAKKIFLRLAGAIELGAAIKPRTIRVGETDVTELDFPNGSSPPVKTFFAAYSGKFAFTTDERTMRQLIEGADSSLEDDPAFTAAKHDAGMPGKTTGFAYGNLREGLPFAFRLAENEGNIIPPEARANTKPLRTTLLYTQKDGKRLRVSGLLTIK
jgi:Protein of unknown function (DUF3352)